MKDNHEQLENKRHSLAHLLAAAVMELYPDAKRAIGPAIEDGFYYDFEFPAGLKIGEEDLPKIENKMRDILATWDEFREREISARDAKASFPGNEYKSELIDEIENKKESITIYQSGKFEDLCRGGHAKSAKDIRPDSFHLDRVAGAYWRGNAANKMLTRIYGLAFGTKAELEDYLKMQAEAAKRDHKKLGRELGLFVFSETVGKGLPLFTAKGATVKRELERFITDEELKRGYLHVDTPDLARLALFEKSGHYPYYRDSMYAPIKIEDEEYMLRPMTCPHHFELYLSEKHSYRELPMRIAELAHLYRYEQSGELMGLLRVRTFCLADAHIVARKEQAQDEINSVLDLIDFVCQTFGLTQGEAYRYRLSLGDRSDDKKYFKDDKSWNEAEQALRSVLKKRNASYYEVEKEAAFYGPKIDIQMKNVSGKEDTAFTVQYDFVMPKRFNLVYTNESGQDEEPIVIHRSSIGALERSLAFLIEHFAGAFPLWLAPVQVAVLPISDEVMAYAKEIAGFLKNQNIRVELDERSESIGKKIREAEKQKIPYMLVVGKKEAESKTVSVRQRGEKDLGRMTLAGLAEKIDEEIESRSIAALA